ELFQSGTRAFHTGGLKKFDQVPALNLNLSRRVQPHEIVERRPAELRADDARMLNQDAEVRMNALAQGDSRAIPELYGKSGVQKLRQVLERRSSRFELSGGRSREESEHRRLPAAAPVAIFVSEVGVEI